jgi:class 3 adenylate cyclase
MARKYPLFLIVTTLLTAIGVFSGMREVLRRSIETEIFKRGESTVDYFARANAPLMLTYPSEPDRAQRQAKINLDAVGRNPDVLDARLADPHGLIVASLDETEVNTRLPQLCADAGASRCRDFRLGAYHFQSAVRYGPDVLGHFALTLSRAPVEAALKRATVSALGFAVGIALLISIFGLILVRSEVRPLKIMQVTLSAISRGDFSQRVPEDRSDEIGELSAAFNRMLRRSEVFFHYVDKMVIERLIADENLVRPGGHEQELAVTFGDMRGYTAMSNRRTADEVVHIVNTYFHLFIECVAHWGGVVDKTMGDAIMAVFERNPAEDSDAHKRRAALAIAYMKAASRILNRFLRARLTQGQKLPVEPREFGFAMASGRAIVGNIGSKRRMDYTVCGRIVNLASRLEGMTKNGEVIIDNFARFATTAVLKTEPLPPVQPKGFSDKEKVTPHRLIGMVDEEAHKMRIFLKRLFVYTFLSETIMPRGLPVGEVQPWCQEAELHLITIIADTPVSDLYARVDIETGDVLPDNAPRPMVPGQLPQPPADPG